MADKSSAPAYSISASKKHNFAQANGIPGPGSYKYVDGSKTERALDRQPRGKRFNEYETITPGPGTYTHQKIDRTHGITFKFKEQKKNVSDVPGPGSYEPDFRCVMKTDYSYKIASGHEPNRAKTLINTPGPGDYETSKSTLVQNQNQIVKFGPERKITLGVNSNVPGPGEYNLQNCYHNGSEPVQPKYKFGKAARSQSTANLSSPSPNSYAVTSQLDEQVKKNKGFIMGTRLNGSMAGINETVGPGSYNIERGDIRKKNPSFSIGRDQKLKIQNLREVMSKPGPLAYPYEKKVSAFDRRSYSMNKEWPRFREIANQVPGPGAYQFRNTPSQPNFTLSKSHRATVTISNNPGPADYQPKKLQDGSYKQVGIGKDKRCSLVANSSYPGPGEYQGISQSSRGGIGHDKRVHEKQSNEPGPGNYNIQSTISNLPQYAVPPRK